MKKKLIIMLSIFLILGVLSTSLIFFEKVKEETPNEISEMEGPKIPVDTAETLYDKFINGCEGAYLLDFKESNTIELDKNSLTSYCVTNAHQKLLGYTDTENGMLMDVQILKEENGNLYNLENNLVERKEEINQSLEEGSIIRYYFQKEENDYKLYQASK